MAVFAAAMLFAAAPLLAAQPIDVLSAQDGLLINEAADVLVDPSGELTIGDVTGPAASRFEPGRHLLNYGMTSAAIWLRFELRVPVGTGPVERTISMESPFTDHADLYVPDGTGGFRVMKNGTAVAFSDRPTQGLHLGYPVRLEPNSRTAFFMRVASEKAMLVNVRLWTAEAFEAHGRRQTTILLFFAGVLAALAAYNFILFAALRDRNHVLLGLFLCAMGLFFGTVFGIAPMILWPEWPEFARIASPLFASLGLLTGTLFGRRFLEIRKWSTAIDRTAKVFAGVSAGLFVLTFVHSYAANLGIAFAGTSLYAAGFVTCLIGLKRQTAAAKYFLLFMALALAGGLYFALLVFGVVGWSFLAYGVGPCAFLFGNFVLTLGIGQRLRQVEAARAAILDTATDAFFVFDAKTGTCAGANRAARERFGYDEPDWNTLTPRDLIDDAPFALDVESLANPDTSLKHAEFVARGKNEERFWCEAVSSAHPLERGEGALLVLRDITGRKDAEEARARVERRLQEVRRMEAIGRLAGGVAHEFNNLLTTINGYAELVQTLFDKSDPIHKDVDEIRHAGERASRLTGQLLAFSRRQVISPRIVDLRQVVEQASPSIQRTVGASVAVSLAADADPVPAKLDPEQVTQILATMAANARDAMPGGGTLTVAVRSVSLDAADGARAGFVGSGDFAELTVTDTGVGMDEETRSRVFEPFFTTGTRCEKGGLGMATVFGVVRQNHGAIRVESEPGKGTTFRVLFPAPSAGETQEMEEQLDRAGRAASRGTVLVVEHDQAVRSLIGRVLEGEGYRVIAVDNAADAERICAKCDDEIHLVVSDVVLPESNGRELYVRLRERRPRIKALFLWEQWGDDHSLRRTAEDGVSHLPEPFTIDSLSQKVKELLGRATS